ncbi:unnamed protein product [Calypogeia fissa]
MESYAVVGGRPGICSSCLDMAPKSPAVGVTTRNLASKLNLSNGGGSNWGFSTGGLRTVKVVGTVSSSSARFGGVSSENRVSLFWKQQLQRSPVTRRCQETNVLSTDEVESASELPGLVKFITSGVLAPVIGSTPENVARRLADWILLGNKLSDFLNFGKDGLSEAEVIRLYQYYLPVFFWCLDQLARHRSRFAPGEPIPPIVIGINAPQGCGKTTVVESLEFLFKSIGRTAVAMSVDDFYLTGADQDKLAADNQDNGLLKFRGNAGSHDLELGTETIESLLKLTSKGSKAKVPRYDKAARNGLGDRADHSDWSDVEGPVQVILFEGWMLGYEPQDNDAVTAIDPQLALVNKNLEGYHDAWHRFINSWMIIEVGDPNWVFEWRLEAELKMRQKGRGGMTDQQIADFVSRYIPAYNAYLPSLYSVGPRNSTADNTLKFSINKERNPVP